MSAPLLTSLSASVNENFTFLLEKKQRTAAPNAIDYRCSQNKILFKQNQFIANNPNVSTKARLPFPVKNNVKKIVQLANIPTSPKVLLNHYLSQNYDLNYSSLRIISAKTGLSISTIQRANKWLSDANILVEKDLGVGRLKCRQVNLRIADWSIQPIERKGYFFDTLRNVLGQIDQLIGINLKPNTSIKEIKENKQKDPMPNVMEIDQRQKEIDAIERDAQIKKRAKLEQKAQEAIEPLLSSPEARKAGFNRSHQIQLVKGIANSGIKNDATLNRQKWRLDQVIRSIENLTKAFSHPLYREYYQKNPPDILFGLLRRGQIFNCVESSMNHELAKRKAAQEEQEKWQQKRPIQAKEPDRIGKVVGNQWEFLRSFMNELEKSQKNTEISEKDQLRYKLFEEKLAKNRLKR